MGTIFVLNIEKKIMKKIYLLYILLISCYFTVAGNTKYELNYSRIKPGEKLYYTAQWGFLSIGSASTIVDNKLYKIGSTICYKIDVQGRTNGLAKLFYVRDKWTAYVDSSNIQTHKSSRNIREGRYALDEMVDFDHENKKATVKVFDKTKKQFQLKKIYDTPENIRDIVGGFMVVRMIELHKLKKGSVFTINGFYEDEGYKIDIEYHGFETIKVNNKYVKCHKMKPIVPKNSVFDGRNSIEVWLSNDEKQNIVRIKAKMFVGSVIVDLAAS
jgi:hypothetical protein